MMRPFEELLAYYRFIQQNGPRKRRPKLSDEAKAMAKIFEKLMRKADYFQKLSELFIGDVSAEELNELIEVYQQSMIDLNVLLDNKVMEPVDVDLTFEKKVAAFTRLQGREELRKRFNELEEVEAITSFDEAENRNVERMSHVNKSESQGTNVFRQILIGMALFYLLIYLIRWLLRV